MNKNLHIKCSKCGINEPVQYLELNYEGFGNGAQEAKGLFNTFNIDNAKKFIDDINEKRYGSTCDSVIISFQRMSKIQYKLMESQSK